LTAKIIRAVPIFQREKETIGKNGSFYWPRNFAAGAQFFAENTDPAMNLISPSQARSAFRAPACRLVVIFFFLAVLVAAGRGATARPGEITHVMIYWLKRPGNSDDRNVLLRAARSLRKVRGVTDFRVGTPFAQIGNEPPFDLSLVLTFRNRRALEKFETDPHRQETIDRALSSLVRRSVVYDFVNE
jgi:hypothetical protein